MTKARLTLYVLALIASVFNAGHNFEKQDYPWVVFHLLLALLYGHWAYQEFNILSAKSK